MTSFLIVSLNFFSKLHECNAKCLLHIIAEKKISRNKPNRVYEEWSFSISPNRDLYLLLVIKTLLPFL